MRIPSGVVDQVINFVAVDETDFVTRETGLTTFTVYYSLNGGSATAMTSPTVAELDATNMPGVYTLLLDESGMVTITAGNQSEELVVHITQADMAPVTRTIEIYRPSVTAGETLTVTSGLASANTTQIEGADPSDTIRDAVVDDATRIDASALNTASVTTIPAILDDTDLIDDGTSGLAKIATDVAAILVDTAAIDGRLPSDPADASVVAGLIATAQADLDILTGADGATLATSQPNYAPATAASLATAQADLDTLTGTDGATLATSQPNYAPATAAALATVDNNVDAIKSKTDSLTFTVAGQLDSNIQYVNDVQVDGVGSEANPWGPV